MPYISTGARDQLKSLPRSVTQPIQRSAMNAGELTYQITEVIQAYLRANGLSYQSIAEILGSLRGAELDLERRIITPYEEKKQEDNGDVWDPELLRVANGR